MDTEEAQAAENYRPGTPAVICRWRLAGKTLPLENRHLHALGKRRIDGKAISPHLIAWAKQHIEGTLQEGSAEDPDGVLLLVIDEQGRAAMAVGPYEPLEDSSLLALATRACAAQREAAKTGCAPEVLWVADKGILTIGKDVSAASAGALSLARDIASTLGYRMDFQENLAVEVLAGATGFDEVFLVSDEHGVVQAADAKGKIGAELAADLEKLYESKRR